MRGMSRSDEKEEKKMTPEDLQLMSAEAGVVGSKPPEKKKREQSNTPSCPVPGNPPKGAPPRSPLRADAPTSEEVASSIDNPTRSREMLSRKGSWAMAMTCLGGDLRATAGPNKHPEAPYEPFWVCTRPGAPSRPSWRSSMSRRSAFASPPES